MQEIERPFEETARYLVVFFGVAAFFSLVAEAAFVTGIFLSITWACIVILADLDIPSYSQTVRATRASVGFFLILVGIVVGVISPNYLYTSPVSTEWLIMVGLFLGAQVGLSLLLNSPLKSLSYSSGHLVSAIVLHSIIIRFPSEFINPNSPKAMVLSSLILASWYLSQTLFFDYQNVPAIDESKNVKRVKSIVGIFSALLTVVEFINILYELFAH